MSCPRTQHLNNVPRLRGEKHDISLKILHQAGFETARQAATSAERHALTIAPCPMSPCNDIFKSHSDQVTTIALSARNTVTSEIILPLNPLTAGAAYLRVFIFY